MIGYDISADLFHLATAHCYRIKSFTSIVTRLSSVWKGLGPSIPKDDIRWEVTVPDISLHLI